MSLLSLHACEIHRPLRPVLAAQPIDPSRNSFLRLDRVPWLLPPLHQGPGKGTQLSIVLASPLRPAPTRALQLGWLQLRGLPFYAPSALQVLNVMPTPRRVKELWHYF